MSTESRQGPVAAPVAERGAPIYDEQAFGYLLAIEQKRSARSAGAFHLLLISPRDERPDGAAVFAPATAARIARALSACVRDTDFIGWYREPGTLGAVLTDHPRGTALDVTVRKFDRVVDGMLARLPADIVKGISVQLVEVPVIHHRSQ